MQNVFPLTHDSSAEVVFIHLVKQALSSLSNHKVIVHELQFHLYIILDIINSGFVLPWWGWGWFLPPARFRKMAGGIVLGSVTVSAVSSDVLPYISVAIKASFLKFGMCNICKNNIAKMFLDLFFNLKLFIS